MDDDPILLLCTAPDLEEGEKLARGLVEAKLAACVNLVPAVRSIYAWKGQVQDESEVQLVIKSRRGREVALEAWVKEHHPYEVPELLFVAVDHSSAEYLRWLLKHTRD